MSVWKPGVPQAKNPAREVVAFHAHRCARCGKYFDVGDRMVLYWSSPNELSFLHPETCCNGITFSPLRHLKWIDAPMGRRLAGGPDSAEYELSRSNNAWGVVKNDDLPLYLGPSLKMAYAIADLDAYLPNYTPPGHLSELFARPGRAKPGNPLRDAKQEERPMATATKSASKKSPAKEKATKPAPAERSPNAATEEEFKAAVEGTLKPRPQAGGKNQDSLKAKGEDDKPSGRPLGVTTGLPIRMNWCLLFQRNEKLPKNQKLTNEQISNAMRKEYPGRDSAVFDSVAYVRRQFNQGILTRNMKPKYESFAYDGEGNKVEGRASSNGTTGGKKATKKPDAGIRTIDGDEADKPSAMERTRAEAAKAAKKKKTIKA